MLLSKELIVSETSPPPPPPRQPPTPPHHLHITYYASHNNVFLCKLGVLVDVNVL